MKTPSAPRYFGSIPPLFAVSLSLVCCRAEGADGLFDLSIPPKLPFFSRCDDVGIIAAARKGITLNPSTLLR